MQEIARWLAGGLGIDVEPGTTLRIELAAWPGGGAALLVLTAAALMLFAIVALYRRDAHALSPGRRGVLCALRCLALVLVGVVLLEPSLVAVKREHRPGEVILLLDTSQSMQRRDGFTSGDVAALRDAWLALGVDPAATDRIGLAKALLQHDGGRLVRVLAERNRVSAYAFAADAEALFTATAGEPLAADLSGVAADGKSTDIGAAMRTTLEKVRDARVAAVVVLSDGRRNTGPPAAEVARLLVRRKVPVVAVGIGDPAETASVALARVEAPDRVPRRDPFRVTARVRVRSATPIEMTLRLVRVAPPQADQVIATKTLAAGGATQEVPVVFEGIAAEDTGPHTYRVDVSSVEAPADPARQVAQVRVEVLDEQIRVLLVAGGPSHEYRMLRTELIRDKTIDVACWLCSADPDFPQDGDTKLEALPQTRAELEAYDVVILIDPDAAKLPPSFGEAASQHVLEDGAGLWWVCGEKFTLDALRDTASTKPLADLLPIVPDLVRADRRVVGFGHAFERAFPYRLTTEGRDPQTDLVVRLAERSEENEALWASLPGYHFAFPVLRSKPAATALIEMVDPETGAVRDEQPLVALQFVGAGRVLYSGTDETYRWRGASEHAYQRYWVNGIRHLAEGRRHAGGGRARLRMDADEIELGQPAAVTLEARDESYHPLVREHVALRVTGPGGDEEVSALAVDGVPGEYRAVFTPAAPGFYTVAVPDSDERGAGTTFQVVPPARESDGPIDLAELGTLAADSGGELCATPQDLLARAARIPSLASVDTIRTSHMLWDGWVTVASLVVILGCEWWLRKYFNLL